MGNEESLPQSPGRHGDGSSSPGGSGIRTSGGNRRGTLRISSQLNEPADQLPARSRTEREPARRAPPEDEADTPDSYRLYQIKGAQQLTMIEVDLSVEMLSADSSFILDAGRTIFLYSGWNCPRRKAAKGEWVAKRLSRQEMNEVPLVPIPVGAERAFPKFWLALGGQDDYRISEHGEDEEEWEYIYNQESRLYRLTDVSHRMRVDVIGGPFSKDMLSSQYAYVLDVYQTIFIWCGRESSTNERSYAMLKAEQLLGSGGRPRCCEISWAVDGAETLYFTEQFYDWTPAEWEEDMRREEEKRLRAATFYPGARRSGSARMSSSSPAQTRRNAARRWSTLERIPARKSERDYESSQSTDEGDWDQPDEKPSDQYEDQSANYLEEMSSQDRPYGKNREEAYSEDIHHSPSPRRQTDDDAYDISPTRADLRDSTPPKKDRIQSKKVRGSHSKAREGSQVTDETVKHESGESSLPSPAAADQERPKKQKKKRREARDNHPHDSPEKLDTAGSPEVEKIKQKDEDLIRKEEAERELKKKQEEERKRDEEKRLREADERKQTEERERQKREERRLEEERKERKRKEEEELRKRKEEEERQREEKLRLEEEERIRKEELRKEEEQRRRDSEAKTLQQQKEAANKQENRGEDKQEKDVYRKLSKQASESVLSQVSRSTSFLKNKDRAMASSGRKKPTKNPVRERAAINALTEKRKEDEKEDEQTAQSSQTSNVVSSPAAQPRNNTAAALGLGGYGVLWSVGANANLFHNRTKEQKEPSNQTAAEKKRLIQIKGRRNVFVREVELTPLSMNSGDVFILDIGTKIYQWCGVASNRMERGRALDVAKKIKDKEHFGRSTIVRVEEGEKKEGYDVAILEQFWKAMGESQIQTVASEEEGGDDKAAEDAYRSLVQLFKTKWGSGGEQAGIVELDLVATPPIDKGTLTTDSCFILDCASEIFVWTGKKSPIKLRNATFKKAQDMSSERTFWVAPVRREIEDGEGVLFKEKFFNWSSTLPIQMQQVASGKNVAASKTQAKIDVLQLHQPPTLTEEVVVDDGRSGFPIQLYRVEDHRKATISGDDVGHFFDAESYIVAYKYIFRNKDAWILYFWQGRNSTIQDKGSSALLTVDLDDKIEGMSKEVRVVQNKEPKHFLSIFSGHMVVHKGKEKSFDPTKARMYQVARLGIQPPRTVQTDAKVSSLNSNNVFILITPPEAKSDYIWIGSCASEEEKTTARDVIARISSWRMSSTKKVEEVDEGSEPSSFWRHLDNDTPDRKYPLQRQSIRREARLFHCSLGTGIFTVHEVPHYCQDDLVRDNAFILDAYDTVYVWLGILVTAKETKMALETAVEYAEKAPDDRQQPVPVRIIKQPAEPLVFTAHFHAWDTTSPRQKEATVVPQPFVGEIEDAREKLAMLGQKYTYEQLSTKQFPHGLDVAHLENYLEEEEFERVFKMTRADFEQLPAWKKTATKKALKLY